MFFLGKEYGAELNEQLYSKIDALLAPIERFNIDKERKNEFENYLRNIVSQDPKVYEAEIHESKWKEYANHIIESEVNYPVNLGYNVVLNSKYDFNSNYSLLFNQIRTPWIYNLWEVLNTAKTSSILELLVKYDSLLSTQYRYIYVTYKYHSRNYSLTTHETYTRFILKTMKWIEIEGKRYAPNQIILNPNIGNKMAPDYIGISKNDLFPKNEFLQQEIKENLISKLGIIDRFDKLPTKEIYKILEKLSLDENDDGEISREIYRDIMDSTSLKDPLEIEKRDFIDNGKVYCFDSKGYNLIQDVKYADKMYPSSFLRYYKLIHIYRSRGALKVKKWFGVDELKIEHHIRYESIHLHEMNAFFQVFFLAIKVAFLAYNWNEISFERKISLKNSKITLCSSALVEFDGKTESIVDYEYSTSEDSRTDFYLVLPKAINDQQKFLYDGKIKIKIVELMLMASNLSGKEYESSIEALYPYPSTLLRNQIEAKFGENNYWDDSYRLINDKEDLMKRVIQHNNDAFENMLIKYKSKYERILYSNLSKQSINEQKTYLSKIENFLSLRLSYEEAQTENIDAYNILLYKEPLLKSDDPLIDINILGIKTKMKLEESFSTHIDKLNSFLTHREIDSLLRFGNFDYIYQEFENELMNTPKNLNPSNSMTNQIPIQSKSKVVVQTPKSSSIRVPKTSIGSYNAGKNDDRDNSDQGEEAEKNALKYIRDKYNVDPIWSSYYARKNNDNLNGSDGKGYDIEFELLTGPRYIEVKSSQGKNRSHTITLTQREYEYACKHPNEYYIFLVFDLDFVPQVSEILFSTIQHNFEPSEYRVQFVLEDE